jgi:plasmid stabilization system protein ParE
VRIDRYAVRWLSIAEQDFQDIILYIAADNISAADRLAQKIERSLRRLVRHPYLGKIPVDYPLAAMGYRMLVIEDYLVFYKIKGKTVLIHRIVHGARDLGGLLDD